MSRFRPTSLKLDSGLVAGNVVSLILAAIAFWHFSTSTHGWNEANDAVKLHVLMGTCVFIGSLVIGLYRIPLQEQDGGPYILFSPAAFITIGLLLFSDTRHYFAPIKSTLFIFAMDFMGVFSGHWLRTTSEYSRHFFFQRIGSILAGGITGVAVAATLLMMASGLGEGGQILFAIPLFVVSPLTGGVVSGFMLSRYCPLSSLKAHLVQLLIFSPALFFMLLIILIQLWKDRVDHSDSTFFFMIIVSIFSWIGSLFGWRLHKYLMQK